MASSNELFTIPIRDSKGHQCGTIVCTTPAPQVYVLTWSAPPDNRLTSGFVAALSAALNAVEFGGYPAGVLVTASALPKFYSNGLDLEAAVGTPGFFERELYPLWRRLLTYPMPTVAVVGGHCFAGGLMLAMHHDYRVFTGGARGFLCLNELEFGMPLMPPMSAVFRLKTSPPVYRRLVLEAHRFGGPEALEAGLVDALGSNSVGSGGGGSSSSSISSMSSGSSDSGAGAGVGVGAALDFIRERGLLAKAKSGVYGLLKAEMYREGVALLDAEGGGRAELAALQAAEKKRKAEGARWMEQLRRSQGDGGSEKPKL
ncbi:hypothetical protein SLS62_006820 [Diatrype stigma]|uniref:Uncharacterized protein n=1 Tax=Diatrype stigma TaxID=117547 RepID=A0AAN9UMQ3_9PEZI